MEKKQHSELTNKITPPQRWFSKFLLTSLCAVAIACPTGAWGDTDEPAIGAGGDISSAILDHDLNIINGKTKTGEKWANIGGSESTTEKDIQGMRIYGVRANIENGDASATMLNETTQKQCSLYISDTATTPAQFEKNIYGGYAFSGGSDSLPEATAIANNNKLTISGGTFNGDVEVGVGYIAYYDSFPEATATAKDNELTISGGTFGSIVMVGAGSISHKSTTAEAIAYNNKLTISGDATFSDEVCVGSSMIEAVSTTATATSNSNSIAISGGTFNSSVYGGNATSLPDSDTAEATANANENEITISGGTFVTESNPINIYAGYAESYSDSAKAEANANKNEITISGVTFVTESNPINIYAGYAVSYSDSAEATANANENEITISGRTFGDSSSALNIYGGYALTNDGTKTEASNNIVSIEKSSDGNNPNLTYATLYGGETAKLDENSNPVHFDGTGTGNTLKISTSGLTAKNVKYFQKYEFILPNTIQSGDPAVLTLTDMDGTDISGTTTNKTQVLAEIQANAKFSEGDTIKLIYNANGITAENVEYGTVAQAEGDSGDYTFTVAKADANTITLTINGVNYAAGIFNITNTSAVLSKALTVDATGKTDSNWEISANSFIAGKTIYGIRTSLISGDASASMSGDGSLTILGTGSDSPKNVYGAYAVTDSGKAEAKDAKLSISGGTFDMNVYGGYANGSTEASATGNAMTISGGTFGTGVESGDYYPDVYGSYAMGSTSAETSNNTIKISDGKFKKFVYGAYADSEGTATANSNTMTISGGTFDTGSVESGVYNGYAQSNSGTATASNNTLTISGGTFSHYVVAGWAEGSTAIASNNSLTISDGEFNGYVFGGSAYGATSATASNNTLTISGGTFGNEKHSIKIFAGYVQAQVDSTNTEASGNTMIIEGSPNLTNAELYGGEIMTSNLAHINDIIKDNTLKVYSSGLTAENVNYFQNYVFVLPNTVKNNDVVLTLTGGSVNEKTDISKSTISVGVKSGSVLSGGDKVILIKNDNGLISTDFKQDNEKIKAEQGIALTYEFDVSATDTELVATVAGADSSEEAEAPLEAQTVAPAMLNQAADLIATEGMQSLTAMPAGGIVGTFGVASAGNLRHKTGSHTNVKGVSTLIGVGKRFDPSYGVLYTGAFFEYGYGDYSAHNDFSTGYVRGDGHSRYYGGGVMARYDIPCGFYGELSLRFGGSDTYWSSKDLGANYDSNGMYFGTHVALGYLWKFAKDFKLDVYGKYFYAYQEGDKVSILGDTFDFDSVNSNRLRLGARLGYDFCEMLAGYVGAAWEREFSGSANATVYGYDVVAPSLRGNSGIFEGGLSFKPKKDLSFSTDIGITGYVGQKKGVTGYLKLNYSF